MTSFFADDHRTVVARSRTMFRAMCSCGAFEVARDTEREADEAARNHVRTQIGLAYLDCYGDDPPWGALCSCFI